MKPRYVFLPYRGEFGFVCMFHAPQVRAVQGDKIVMLEQGKEALYPGCEYYYVPKCADEHRRARVETNFMQQMKDMFLADVGNDPSGRPWMFIEPNQRAKRQYFKPEPYVYCGTLPPEIDVVVCPRKRKYGSDKNWLLWQELVDSLIDAGVSVYAVGHPESSFDLNHCGKAWSKRLGVRYLDNTIAILDRARVVIATDNGLAHLAVMMGKKLRLVSHGQGLVADGCDDVGNRYWPIKMKRFHGANHLNADIQIIPHSWYTTAPVLECIQNIIPGRRFV